MLTDSEITSARDALANALPDTATIRRHTTASDGGGGTTQTWADLATTACRISPVGGGEGATDGDRIADESTHIATLPAETDVTESDRLIVAGRTYEVTLVRSRGTWELSRRCEIKEAA